MSVSPLFARIRRATSAPVTLPAGTSLHFANELFTQCWAQSPNTSGMMKKTNQYMSASCHHDSRIQRDHAARLRAERIDLDLRQVRPAGQHVADGARRPRD